MRKLAAVLSAVVLVGCAPFPEEAARRPVQPDPGWRFDLETSLSLIEAPAGADLGSSTADIEGLRFEFKPGREYFRLVLTNQRAETVRIPWDDAAFIDVEGVSGRVVTGDVRRIDLHRPQAPSVIPAGSRIEVAVIPARSVGTSTLMAFLPEVYRVVYQASEPTLEDMPEGIAEAAAILEGLRVGLLLPVEMRGDIAEYTFWFEVQTETVGPRRVGRF
jgi:hypothetical protein